MATDSASSAMILVVEDDENDSIMLMRELKRGHLEDNVKLMTDGHAARNYLLETEQPPMVLFLDLGLPGIGGLHLLQRIRQVERLRNLPVIVMSGSVNPQDRKACSEFKVLAFLEKPVALASFIHIVTHLFPEQNAGQKEEFNEKSA